MTDPIELESEAWPEARGPHLPDWLTAIPALVWPFVVLAFIEILAFWTANRGATPVTIGWSALGAIGDLAACLLGAALLIRHPDAIRSMPLLVVGVTLVAAEQALQLLGAPLRPLLETVISSPDGDPTGWMIASSAFRQVGSIAGLFGFLYLARGLDRARRFEGGASRVVFIVLAASSVVSIAISAGFVLRVAADDIAGGIPLYLVSVIVGVGALVATSYLAAVASGGWRGGEEPRLAWLLVAMWGILTIGAGAVFTFATVIVGFGQVDLSWAFLCITAAAGLALLSAFALGLPSTEPVELEAS